MAKAKVQGKSCTYRSLEIGWTIKNLYFSDVKHEQLYFDRAQYKREGKL